MKKAVIGVMVLASVMALSACGGGGKEKEPTPEKPKADYVYDTVLLPERKSEVSPFIYGEFLEHIHGCIYNVIWSELIKDRKFYYAPGEAGLSPWKVSGDVESSDECYSDNGHCAVLKEGGSISMELDLPAGDLTGYFYADGTGTVEVSVGGDKKEIAVSGAFKKYTYAAAGEGGKQTVSFTCKSGSVKLDSLSLMPADNIHGMRKDSLDAMKELAGTVYRWPGGNFVSGYDWEDGVGDIDKRPSKRNAAWFADNGVAADKALLAKNNFYDLIEPNDMGTEEFLAMCEYIGATPYLAVNTGSRSAQPKESGADLVEYCNGAATTVQGARRAANGHAEPYNVKYWCVGNEMQGDWQIGHMSSGEYVKVHNAFAEAMRAVDDSIVLTGCGDNCTSWTESMFASCAKNLDLIGEHLYEPSMNSYSPAEHMQAIKNNLDMRIKNHRDLLEEFEDASHVKIAFDEYNYLWKTNATLRDALGIGAALNMFIENADVVAMANYSDAIFTSTRNAPGAIYAKLTGGTTFSPVGEVLKAYAKNMQPYQAAVTVRQTDRDTRIDAQATVSEDGKTITFSIVNPSEKTVEINVKTPGKALRAISVSGTDPFGTTAAVETTESPAYLVSKPLSIMLVVYQIG